MKENIKKVIGLLLICTMVLGLMAGCSSSSSGDSSGGTEGGDGTLQSMISSDEEYIVVNCINNIEYWNAHKYGLEMAAELFGVKVSWTGPADDNVNEMATAMDSAIARQPKGIIVFGYDEAIAPYITKAQDAGIKVVTYNGDVGEDRSSYIGTQSYDLGYQGAKLYAEMIGGEGKVAILTISGVKMQEERLEGFEDGFAEYPDIEVVAVGDTGADSATAISTAKDIAVKYDDLTGFVCTDSTGAAGAATALQEVGKTDSVDVLGLDRNSDTLQLIKDGTITGSLCQNDVSQTYWALVELITEVHVDLPLSSDDEAAGAKTAPNAIYTSVNLITQENVDYYIEQNEIYATNGL